MMIVMMMMMTMMMMTMIRQSIIFAISPKLVHWPLNG